MLVTTADLWEPRAGTLLRWDVSAPASGARVSLSLNQRNHLAAARAGAPTVWLAAAFDVDGPIDPVALTSTWRAFVARHSSLQLEVIAGPEGPRARRHRPAALTWSLTSVGPTGSGEETRAALRAALDERCAPSGYPAFLPAAISRADRSTIVLGMDHLHCDALSVAVAVEELAHLYAAFTEAGEAVRRGVRLASVPLDQVIGSLPEPLVQTRDDVFVVSWVDYRHVPGGSAHLARDAQHISASAPADDVQIWFSRTHTGLAVRIRHPDTATATASVSGLLDRLEHALIELSAPAESAQTDQIDRRVGSS